MEEASMLEELLADQDGASWEGFLRAILGGGEESLLEADADEEGPQEWRTTDSLVLSPARADCCADPERDTWQLYVDGQRVCDARAVRELCGAARALPQLASSVQDGAAPLRRPAFPNNNGNSWGGASTLFVHECCVGKHTKVMHLPADGRLGITGTTGDDIVIPAADIVARLDGWTPMWRLSRMSAIESAPDAPADEGV